MSENNFVTIGGEAIVLPPILNFASLKRVWPAMRASGAATDSTDRVAADIAVIAAGRPRDGPSRRLSRLTIPSPSGPRTLSTGASSPGRMSGTPADATSTI